MERDTGLPRDAVVHVEQVAVLLADLVFAVALDRRREIQVHATTAGPDAAAVVDCSFAAREAIVARREVAERRYFRSR